MTDSYEEKTNWRLQTRVILFLVLAVDISSAIERTNQTARKRDSRWTSLLMKWRPVKWDELTRSLFG
ncbi:hypothetical protein AB6A40_008288 [Gnathostoma spinigerum]|uniref:Uncharacterized protein n=1 Tax=Gnathostoma spinigerum TaxID=75299 RepID=A0ABD6ETS7_9BILA